MPWRRFYLVLLVAWVGFTFVLTSIPHLDLERYSFRFADKLAHAGVYAVTGLLFALWRRAGGDTALAAIAGAVAFVAVAGAVDEAHQYFVPGRSMDARDLAADLVGGAAGAVAHAFAVRKVPFLLPTE